MDFKCFTHFFILFIIIVKKALSNEITIEKSIDNLYNSNIEPRNIYWIDNVEGKCNVNTEFKNESLSVSYKFTTQSKSDFFEILMNYGKNTQNLNCKNPNGISLIIKLDETINMTNKDILKFMLIEDLDMDGELNGDDGVFAFDFQLNTITSEWYELKMPYKNFYLWYSNTKLVNKKLNLDKIRAWRITIFNENNNQQFYKLYLKNLRISCIAKPLIDQVNKQIIKSTFIQLWNDAGCACGEWSLARWVFEINKMIKIGIERLIIQYSIYDTHSWYQNNPVGMSTLDKIMIAAEYNGNFKVVFGLYFDETWNWKSKYNPNTYNELLIKHKNVIDELNQRFGHKHQFGGFYLPQEWNNVEWKNDSSIKLLAEWTRNVLVYAKTKRISSFIISPFFRSKISKELTIQLYETYLSIVSNNNNGPFIDEIYIQDSYGVEESLRNSLFDIYTYIEAIKPVAEKYGSHIGVTIENFNQTKTNGSFAAIPATIDRLYSQINISNYITNKLVQFEWGYMMMNNYKLYNDYIIKIL